MPTSSFTQLDVRKKSRDVTKLVFKLADGLPRHHQFGLAAQMLRAVTSIGSNIAEGYGRRTPRDKAHFYAVSKGSSEELQYLLIVCMDQGYLTGKEEVWRLLDDVGAMLRRLIQKTLEWR